MTQQQDAPVVITSARGGRSADIRSREAKYLLSMAIRTISFVGAVVASGPLRWVLVAAAVFLPYFAVVVANAADGRRGDAPESFEPPGPEQLSGASARLPARRAGDETTIT